MWRAATIGVLAFAACPMVQAQSTASYEIAEAQRHVETCLSEVQSGERDARSCIGASVAPCATDAITTVDMLSCIEPELVIWDERLNAAYAELLRVYGEQDLEDDPIRALAPRLEQVQTQWRTWRDAKCGFAYAQFRGGSMGRITGSDCHLRETGLRALELEALLEDAQL